MRIACLQFAPQVGDVDNNLNRADSVLNRANPEDLDLLVLPELAFSGYNFKSLNEIAPFLEPSGAGITSLWARTTALKHNCIVAAGYPEKVDVSRKWPTSPEYYNSLIVVNEDGETTANYRKTHLYYTDETWALENPDGFFEGHIDGLGQTAMGICMDLNPYRFEAPWSAYEFAFHVLDSRANIVIVSMAWLTREDAREFSRMPNEPDMDTVTYWIKRLEPIIRAENDEETIIIFANRSGVEGDAVYAGTSAVIGIKEGEVNVYGILGRGEKELLVVDTDTEPFAKLVYRPEPLTSDKTKNEDAAKPASQQGAETQRPPSGASSILSGVSSSLDAKGIPSNVSIVSSNDAHTIYGGHVTITQHVPTPITATNPSTPFYETPSSPMYFWVPPENFRTPALPTPPISSSLSRPRGPSIPEGVLAENALRQIKPHKRAQSQQEEIEEMIRNLRKTSATPSDNKNANPARPSSPKSRNCSRTGRGERSDSVLAKRPPSALANHQSESQSAPDAAPPRPEAPKSRNASRNQSRPQQPVANAEQQAYRIPSPDLVKIGADLMVFEEGTRPRRDSLECHADEDDFIVVHSSKRDQLQASKPDKSKQSSQHGKGRTRSSSNRQPPKQASTSSSHRTKLPKNPGSPPNSSDKSDPTSLSDQSHDSPGLPETRNASRGRPRHTPWSPRNDSPTFTPPTWHKTGSRNDAIRTADKHEISFSPSNREEPKAKTRRLPNIVNETTDSDRPSSSKSMNAADKTKSPKSCDDKIASPKGLSISTEDNANSPATSPAAPRTPRAMILYQESGDEASYIPKSFNVAHSSEETGPLKCADRDPDRKGADRPKTVMW